MNRVMFKPYTNKQIEMIINVLITSIFIEQDRLQELSVFTPEAIALCSRKVSSISGDIRRALAIAQRGVEIACERHLEKQLNHMRNDYQSSNWCDFRSFERT